MTNNLPSGTVTFLFTDIEGSTQLWEKHPEAMKNALAKHDSVLKEAIESNHGYIIKTTGDGVHAVFPTAIDAINAAIHAQHNLHIKIRMGLHTGEAELRDNDYYGQALNRAARIMAAGHGGQILLSSITAELAREHLPSNTSLIDLGEQRLKDLIRPEKIFQLNAPDLQKDFPALASIKAANNNLPVQLTSFIGRERELAEAKQKLEGAPADPDRPGRHRQDAPLFTTRSGYDPQFQRWSLAGGAGSARRVVAYPSNRRIGSGRARTKGHAPFGYRHQFSACEKSVAHSG